MREDIISSLDTRLKTQLCTLKKASWDNSNGINMCESEIIAIDFDKIPKQYSRGRGWRGVPKSNDALYVDKKGEWYFIEFKNGDIKKADIYRKLYDSIIMLLDWGVIPDLEYVRKNVNYILVYNSKQDGVIQESSSRDQTFDFVRRLALEEKKLFDVHNFEKYLFKEAHTYSKELFQEKFVLVMENEERTS